MIDDFHHTLTKAAEEAANYKVKFLNINIPPRLGKTELMGVMFIAWSIAKNPFAQFIYITASDELRADTSKRIRDIVSSSEYKRLFKISLSKDQTATNLWKTKEGGGVKASTIKGQITGFGAGRVPSLIDGEFVHEKGFDGAVIFDDIDKLDDTEQNNANSAKIIRTIFNTAISRTNAPDTPFINIQQRAGINDSTANMLKYFGDGKINTYKSMTINGKLGVCKSVVLPVISDGKTISERLYPLPAIEKQRNDPKTKGMFQSQMMQNPQPKEGLCFPDSEIYYVDNMEECEWHYEIIVSDPADRGKDYFASVHLGINVDTQLVYVLDFPVYTQEDMTITIPNTVNYTKRNVNISYFYMEKNTLNNTDITRIINELNGHVVSEFIISDRNKEVKIEQSSPSILHYFRFRKEQTEKYSNAMNVITSYQKMIKNQIDDAADVLSLAEEILTTKHNMFNMFDNK